MNTFCSGYYSDFDWGAVLFVQATNQTLSSFTENKYKVFTPLQLVLLYTMHHRFWLIFLYQILSNAEKKGD